MKNIFYSELSELAREALVELDEYERTREPSEVFRKIRLLAEPCLDGDKLLAGLKNDLALKDQAAFASWVGRIRNIVSLGFSNGQPSHENQAIRNTLVAFKNKLDELSRRTKGSKRNAIFYSWQSQLPNSTNRSFIRLSLELACDELNKSMSLEDRENGGEAAIDSDTQGVTGSPDIIHTILKKIDQSQIFVADVSLIDGRPNSNVMFELGYAMKAVGDPNIIMIFNEATGAAKDLPFDLGFKRQVIYMAREEDENKKDARKLLSRRLKSSIEAILNRVDD